MNMVQRLASIFGAKQTPGKRVTDVVCGMAVGTDSKLTSRYNGRQYYFCSGHCKAQFDVSPKAYVETQ